MSDDNATRYAAFCQFRREIRGSRAHVIVGTPGRILDHLSSNRLSFDDVRILVFDEADELLSLGFWPDMKEINSYLPKDRQSCLFSATIPERVQSLSRVFLRDPEFVTLSADQVAPREISHFFVVTTAQEKDANLLRILEYEDPESAIVFCNTKSDVRYVTAYLQRHDWDADQISGDLTQVAREQAMGRIKAGKLRFLVATDVAARGIDVAELPHVVNFDVPVVAEDYIHRVGRTARAERTGDALTLASPDEAGELAAIERAIGRGILALCAEALGAMEAAKDLTVDYLKTRVQFGKPIGANQVLQHRMVDIMLEIEQLRSCLMLAASTLEADRATRERNLSAAKHLAGRVGRLVAEETIQMHGGVAMTWDFALPHYAKRIVMIDHLFGDTDHHLERFIRFSMEGE